ncbi:hypothetical protein CALVIDRAFT_601792 [Calocera viscosa TUFC12733]|uniref:DUF7770 domain-containing protein n=1 Tax=Calocera viscosa (strain TUFC12733) TaxID=1330018 RepID=A0A167HYP9_CALVF|nr:hypothetical protein CALVIDRAFT_601792 [Calocera viscosa TUFC12733]
MGHVDMQNVRALWHMMRFVPPDLVINNLTTGCSAIILCSAYVPLSPTSPNVPDPSNPNHWFLVLVLSNSLHLRLEVSPSDTGLALVTVDRAPANLSRRPLNPRDIFWMVLASQDTGTTVMDIFHTLITNALHQFSFTADGRGERHWIRAAVFHLEAGRILPPGSLSSVDDVIHRHWWRNAMCIRDAPVVPGTFYTCYGCETGRRQYCDHEQTYPWAMAGMRRRQHGFH